MWILMSHAFQPTLNCLSNVGRPESIVGRKGKHGFDKEKSRENGQDGRLEKATGTHCPASIGKAEKQDKTNAALGKLD